MGTKQRSATKGTDKPVGPVRRSVLWVVFGLFGIIYVGVVSHLTADRLTRGHAVVIGLINIGAAAYLALSGNGPPQTKQPTDQTGTNADR